MTTEPRRLSWAEAIELSGESFDEIERRREQLAEREAELVERSDLPKGRQSKGSVDDEVPALADVIAGALSRNVLTGPMLLARVILEAGYAREARVRAEVAEQIALLSTRAFDAESALAELVRLKDGPRDAAYERDKPLAWSRARAVLAQVPESDVTIARATD